jgi:hypothetical protein
LRERLSATARVTGRETVIVSLQQTEAAHAYPTGDLFRRIEVGVELHDPAGRSRGRDVRYLARHFEVGPGQRGRQLVRDDRIFDEPVEVELDAAIDPALASDVEISWWVTYQRVAQAFDGRAPGAAEVESEVPLHAGTLFEANERVERSRQP